MPMDTTVLCPVLDPLSNQPPSLFRAHTPAPTVKVAQCPVRQWVHEAEHLPSPTDAKVMLVGCQPGTIVAVRERFRGIA